MRRTFAPLAFALTLPVLIAAGEPPRVTGDALETAVLVLKSLDNYSQGPLAGASWLTDEDPVEEGDRTLPRITVSKLTVIPRATRGASSGQRDYYDVRLSLVLDCPAGFQHGVRALESCLAAFDNFNGDDLTTELGVMVVEPVAHQIVVNDVHIQLPRAVLTAPAGLTDGPRTHVSKRIASAQLSTPFSLKDSRQSTSQGYQGLIFFKTVRSGAKIEDCGRLIQQLSAGPDGIALRSLQIEPFREVEEELVGDAEPREPVAEAEPNSPTWSLSLELLVGAGD